ncbi:MAG: hypothetical protein H7Z75_04840 [Ferruginibacter sp.]|nr:hypothetical protein [Cytophagales bacterium]
MEREITNEELVSLSSAILTRYDVDFTGYELQSFKRRISRALSVFGLDSTHSLWIKLLKERDFIYPLTDEITVGLTAMFRDPVLWTKLSRSVLRALNKKDPIRIWHAGCSTGEEVYTMGIVLDEIKLRERAVVWATDINSQALEKAKEGKYAALKIPEYAANYKEFNPFRRFERYYTLQQEVAQFDPALVHQVGFQYHNLVAHPVTEKFDLILCRNVMIYLDTKAKLKLLEQIYHSLNEGGFFVIGFYDALVPLIDNRMFSFYDMEAKIFQRKS